MLELGLTLCSLFEFIYLKEVENRRHTVTVHKKLVIGTGYINSTVLIFQLKCVLSSKD
jgi:hypothetical protein